MFNSAWFRNKMKVGLLLITLVGAASAVPTRQQRIVGGEPTTIERYNFAASMHYYWWSILWYQACGGALLTSSTVLSAAHCFDGDRANQWRVQVGSSYPETGGSLHSVSQLINHPGYHGSHLSNDVAIVRLSSSVVLGPLVGTARIAGPNYNLPDNTYITAIGWGSLYAGGPSPDVLHHVDIPTVNWNECARRYADLKTQPGYQNWPDITTGMHCAGYLDRGGKDACQGDSGGPVVHNNDVVYGVTSWGKGCAHETYPGVNAHVPFYSEWIISNGST